MVCGGCIKNSTLTFFVAKNEARNMLKALKTFLIFGVRSDHACSVPCQSTLALRTPRYYGHSLLRKNPALLPAKAND